MRSPANSARTRCQALASLALPIARAKPALTGAVKPRRNTLSQPRRLAWPQQTARKCPRRGRAAPGVLRAGGAAGSEHEADGVAQSYKNITIKNARGKPGPDEKLAVAHGAGRARRSARRRWLASLPRGGSSDAAGLLPMVAGPPQVGSLRSPTRPPQPAYSGSRSAASSGLRCGDWQRPCRLAPLADVAERRWRRSARLRAGSGDAGPGQRRCRVAAVCSRRSVLGRELSHESDRPERLRAG